MENPNVADVRRGRDGGGGGLGNDAGFDEHVNAEKEKKKKKKKEEGGKAELSRRKSVPCPKGKLFKLGIGAFKAAREWIMELLSHKIGEIHTKLTC